MRISLDQLQESQDEDEGMLTGKSRENIIDNKRRATIKTCKNNNKTDFSIQNKHLSQSMDQSKASLKSLGVEYMHPKAYLKDVNKYLSYRSVMATCNNKKYIANKQLQNS